MSKHNGRKFRRQVAGGDTPVVGRYIRITQPNPTFMNIAEIEVYDENNVKITSGITATASSNYLDRFPPSRLIDGDKTNFAHTNARAGEYFQLDLGSDKKISHVVITNRYENSEALLQRIAGSVFQINNNAGQEVFKYVINNVSPVYDIATTTSYAPPVGSYSAPVGSLLEDVWQTIPGEFKHVSVDPEWTWAVSPTDSVFKCKTPCDGKWENVPGSLKQVDVGGKEVWGVDSNLKIFRRPKDGSGEWTNLPGLLTHVSSGPNGQVWGVNHKGEIFTFVNNNWVFVKGALSMVDVGPDDVWGTNWKNMVYTQPNTTTYANWTLIPGQMKYVSSGTNEVIGISPTNEVYSCQKPCKGDWKKINGLLKQVDITGTNAMGVNDQNNVMYRTKPVAPVAVAPSAPVAPAVVQSAPSAPVATGTDVFNKFADTVSKIPPPVPVIGSQQTGPAPAPAPSGPELNDNWMCIADMSAPVKRFGNDVGCLTLDGKTCLYDYCTNPSSKFPADAKPLICGNDYQSKFGSTGYESPDSWCSRVNRVLPAGAPSDLTAPSLSPSDSPSVTSPSATFTSAPTSVTSPTFTSEPLPASVFTSLGSGICITNSGMYPAYEQRVMSEAECSAFCQKDEDCMGYAMSTDGNCQLYNTKTANIPRTAKSGETLDRANGNTSWTCKVKTPKVAVKVPFDTTTPLSGAPVAPVISSPQFQDVQTTKPPQISSQPVGSLASAIYGTVSCNEYFKEWIAPPAPALQQQRGGANRINTAGKPKPSGKYTQYPECYGSPNIGECVNKSNEKCHKDLDRAKTLIKRQQIALRKLSSK